MKVLVTGGTGFLGSNLIERLRQRGEDVRCVAKDRLNAAALESLNVEIVLGDLNNGLGWDFILDGVDRIYHLAGVTRAARLKEYYEGNQMATKHLVEICLRHAKNVKRLVYVSSLAAVGPSLDGKPVDEETEYHPITDYGKSKMLAELEVRRASDRLPVTILRPSSVYGPRERDWLEYFKLVKRGFQPLMGLREKFMSLLHCDDLIDGILSASEHPKALGEAYFVGSEEYYTTEEIATVISDVSDSRPWRIRLPHALAYAAGAISGFVGRLTGKSTLFTYQKAKESVQPAWICSVEKARSHFGFRQHISLSDGMRRTYHWYRENGWL